MIDILDDIAFQYTMDVFYDPVQQFQQYRMKDIDQQYANRFCLNRGDIVCLQYIDDDVFHGFHYFHRFSNFEN